MPIFILFTAPVVGYFIGKRLAYQKYSSALRAHTGKAMMNTFGKSLEDVVYQDPDL
tara:strand:+ start:97 stop:264 length:168 start_codon:yes stop_codon:yes gene_type:complete